ALAVQARYDLPAQYSSTSEHIAPAIITGTTSFDASAMLPLFTALTVDQLPSLSWTGGGTGGTLVAREALAGMLQWDAYVAPSATAVTFPALPADLGIPAPLSWGLVTVTKLDVPSAIGAYLARTVDRTWGQWPNNADLLPPEGSSVARILYSAALGPPITAS